MYVTITLIICLSVVFVITLGIVSNTLRDENFKTHFDKSNERLKRIIKKQHDELISYREAIKKNDANLEISKCISFCFRCCQQKNISFERYRRSSIHVKG